MTMLTTFQRILRRDKADRVAEASDAYDKALAAMQERKAAGDTRGQHYAAKRLRKALHARIREELSDG